jgi:hypothetical protein
MMVLAEVIGDCIEPGTEVVAFVIFLASRSLMDVLSMPLTNIRISQS